MPRIIFAHKNPRADNPSARHEGLGVTAGNLAETLVENGIQADTAPVVDGYHLRVKLAANAWPGLTHVIMCAPYMDTPFLEGLCRQFPSLKFATVYHSNVGFLQADNWAVKVMREQAALEKRIKNYHLAGNSDKFCQSVTGAYGVPCTYLPNLYFLHGPVARQRAPWKGPDLHIGIFGAIRQLKNLMTGVWASIQIGRDLEANTFIHIVGAVDGEFHQGYLVEPPDLFQLHPDQDPRQSRFRRRGQRQERQQDADCRLRHRPAANHLPLP